MCRPHARHMANTISTLKIHKHHRRYELEGTDSSLSARGGMRRGSICTGEGTWSVWLNDFWRTGATAGTDFGVGVRLDPRRADVPGGSANWQAGRTFRAYHGVLTRGTDRIAIHQPAFRGRPIRVEISGSWPSQDLVVLTACFVVISQRRRDRLRMLQIAAMTSHGPR